MATNLVSYVTQFLTPELIGRIAAALGLNRSDAQSGVSAVVPALLSAFSGVADKPGGAQNLVNAIRQQSGALDNFAGMIGGSNQSSLIERGSSLLTSLLGSHDQTALAGAIARFAGIGQNAASSLLSMLTPVVMGLIGRQIGTRNLDAGSLTSLLASQKEQIAQAMPAGMGHLLEGAGLDSVRGAAASAAAQASRASTAATGQFAQHTSSGARSVGTAGERAAGAATSGIPSWAYWVLPLIVLAGVLWYLLGKPAQHELVTREQPAAPTHGMVVGGVDVERELRDGLSGLQTSLQSVTDVASATVARPKVEAASTQIDKVSDLVGQLTPDQRKIVGGVVASAMPTINQLSDKALEVPGVSEVLRPIIDPVKTKLTALSGQPGTVGAGH